MNRQQSLDRLNLHDDQIFDEHIDPISHINLGSVINNGQSTTAPLILFKSIT